MDGIKRCQAIMGSLLYYAQNINPTMLVAKGTISVAQSKGTEATTSAVTYLLDYCVTNLMAIIGLGGSAPKC
eukprot:14938746-Ditylum_brightwellii.AAC.1